MQGLYLRADNMTGEMDVVKRLQEMGVYSCNEAEIRNALRASVEYIKAYCNIKRVPRELYDTAVDMAVGRLLENMLSKGELKWGSAELENENVKAVTEGDVSVTLGEGSASMERVERHISGLCNKEHILVRYRRLRW